jgi:regulator of sigma E protease
MTIDVILNIIYFLLSLTVLVSIHELGHLSMAKLFGVYCEEYSIGFGPKIVSIAPKGFNRKGQPRETKFSIRAIPLGGYVAMAGEGMEDEESLKQVPPHRFLQGIAKWKRAIIMIAGVTLNFILGFLLLFASVLTTPIHIDNTSTSMNFYTLAASAPEGTEKTLLVSNELDINEIVVTANISGSEKVTTYTIVPGTITKESELGNFLNDISSVGTTSVNDTIKVVFNVEEGDPISFEMKTVANKGENSNEITYSWDTKIGWERDVYSPNFSQKLVLTGDRFVDCCLAIYKALGTIFTKEGLNNLGGPIAIVQQQMQISQLGFGYFLYFWGLISCNLAIFNLLPFPGLDGWHFLVLIIEGITRKEINPKVKSIMSTIGMLLLFGLMILVTFKDIFSLFMLML